MEQVIARIPTRLNNNYFCCLQRLNLSTSASECKFVAFNKESAVLNFFRFIALINLAITIDSLFFPLIVHKTGLELHFCNQTPSRLGPPERKKNSLGQTSPANAASLGVVYWKKCQFFRPWNKRCCRWLRWTKCRLLWKRCARVQQAFLRQDFSISCWSRLFSLYDKLLFFTRFLKFCILGLRPLTASKIQPNRFDSSYSPYWFIIKLTILYHKSMVNFLIFRKYLKKSKWFSTLIFSSLFKTFCVFA